MTDWTALTTWTASAPTAAQLNAQWRDNLLHLYERIDQWGFPYAPVDPRFGTGVGTNQFSSFPTYTRSTGRGTISAIRIRVQTAAGSIMLGCYRNNSEQDTPGNKLGNSALATCPAAGTADVALIASADMEPRDWFAWVGTSLSAAIYGPAAAGGGVTSWPIYSSNMRLLALANTQTDTDLPLTADTIPTVSGSGVGPAFVGVA